MNMNMRESGFAYAAFIVSVLVLTPALFVFFASILNWPESHPLAVVAFPLILLAALPEIPLASISLALGFPVVLPFVGLVLGGISLYRTEPARGFAITAIAFVVVSIALYLSLRVVETALLPQEEAPVSVRIVATRA